MDVPLLLPYPQDLTLTGGILELLPNKQIVIDNDAPISIYSTAEKFIEAFDSHLDWRIVAQNHAESEKVGLHITLDPSIAKSQGYHLVIDESKITLTANDEAGAFYGVMTLNQLVSQFNMTLPQLSITDHPDLPVRGVLHDVSRDRVPTMQTLFSLVDKLASWKINQFQLSTEHTFAYRDHADVWSYASPITPEQYQQLDAYCRERFIDLVPNQQCFGHLHRWFEHDSYQHLAEAPDGWETPWGHKRKVPFSLSPALPESLTFVDGLLDDLLPNSQSQLFNANCDETWDVGQGRSKALVGEKGKGRVYLDFLIEIYKRVKQRGRTMQFWGDIIGNHPELVPEIPKDTIAMEWGYEADHHFPERTKMFAESGIPFYVCPGTSSWRTFAGRTDNMRANILNAVENGIKHGAIGMLNTDWGDGGHPQPLIVSYAGFMYGAGVSWALDANYDIALAPVLNAFAFKDSAGVIGGIMLDLGNVYQYPAKLIHNGSVLFDAYLTPLDANELPSNLSDIDVDKLHYTLEYIDNVMSSLPQAKMACDDADTVMQELRLIASLLKHGAKRLLVMYGDTDYTADAIEKEFAVIRGKYEQSWLARSRSGGLTDSLKRLTRERSVYE